MTTRTIRILLIEDSHKDAQLALAELRQNQYNPVFERVETEQALIEALSNPDQAWDIILSDYQLPQFNGLEALKIVKETGLDIPFILMSGAVGEETAVMAMKEGAHDYILKSNLTRLVPAIEREMKEAQMRALKRKAEEEIRILNKELEQRVLERTAELTEALVQLQESDHFRTSFISALTHDLRTPLIGQERAIEILCDFKDELPQAFGKLTEQLLKSNRDLLKMVNMLLETYHYEAGRIQLMLNPVDLYQLGADCLTEIHELAKTKGIQLSNQIPETFPVVVGDRDQLKRVFMNLIGNALQNIPAESEVILRGIAQDEYVELHVIDTGPGIPAEILPHLFKRYYVGEHTKKKIGSGLGLSICRMIMELHQGTITVESTLHEGTVFYIKLPKQPAPLQSDLREKIEF